MPSCQHQNNKVTDKRGKIGATPSIYRRRVCTDCGHRFSTYELVLTHKEMMALTSQNRTERALDLNERVISSLVERLCVADA